jgi:hypothetical protein
MNTQPSGVKSRLANLVSSGRGLLRRALGPIYRPARRIGRFLGWVIPSLGGLLLPTPAGERRVLLIYDTYSQPFNIGDIVILQEGSLVLRERHNADLVDFAIVYDPKHPAASDRAFVDITEDNALYHLASILPVAQVNQHLGSVFLFNSYRQLERFVADNTGHYEVWPSGWKFGSRDYLYYEVFNDLLYNHYKKHGSIPHLTCRPFLADWAQAFFRRHVQPSVPVTVNVRNNKAFHPHRNLRLECWLEFFRHCETRYPAKFVIICARAEIDERLRLCPNVIIAKDHHTGIEQDLTLIEASAIHMGAGSGPASMAWFTKKPYLMVNTVYGPGYFAHPGMIQQDGDDIQRFWFSTPHQRISGGVETTELLVREFASMWAAIDVDPWQHSSSSEPGSESDVSLWLR